MGVSIALCTYNGERFLGQQLDSIAAQERPPDELVVSDDCSTDRTAEMVRRFAETAPFPVRLSVNRDNVGSTRNFSAAIQRCRHEFILLADQDDVWLPRKVAALESALSESDAVGFACSDAVRINDCSQPIPGSLWDAIRFSRRERRLMREGRSFKVLSRRNTVTGATMAFRAKFKDWLLPVPAEWVHDGWIALLIAAVAECRLVEEPLLFYRQHAGQQLGEQRRGLYRQYLAAKAMSQGDFRHTANAFALACERLKDAGDALRVPDAAERLNEKVRHWDARTRMRNADVRRLPLILREIVAGRYRRCSLGWKCVAQDLFL
jgi:glycosyltransferase involved in cell wall biosynthesis